MTKPLFNKQKIAIIIFCVMLAYLLFPSNLHNRLYPIDSEEDYLWKTLDPSWVLTLNYANLKELIWGKDFVFTFGPLGFLSTKFLWGVNKYWVLFFDLFVTFNFFFIFKKVILNSSNKIFAGLVVGVITLILPIYFGSSIALILLSFLIFWIIDSLKNLNFLNYFFQITLVVLMFFIKVNTGIVALILFITSLSYQFYLQKNQWKFLISALTITFVSIYSLSIYLKVEIWNYIFYSLDIIKGFNEVMYIPFNFDFSYFYLAILLLVLLLTLLAIEIKKTKNWNEKIKVLFLFFLLGAMWYIAYKQGFVRADLGHVVEYFVSSSLILLFLFPLFFHKYFKLLKLAIPIILLINVFVVFSNTNQRKQLVEKLYKTNYIHSFLNYSSTDGVMLFPNNNQLPADVKNIIGLNSVDTYPWNSYLLLENKLNFIPRPVFQSYTTYTKKLQKLNFNYYNSSKAPNYIIYDIGSIDNRYFFWDDALLNSTIINQYQLKKSFIFKNREHLLLEKKDIIKKNNLVKHREYAIFAGDHIITEDNIYYEIELFKNLKGSLKSFFFHSPEIEIDISVAGETPKTFKTSNELLKAGLFSKYYISNTDDFKQLINEGNNNKPISKINIRPLNKSYFKQKIKVTEYKIVQE